MKNIKAVISKIEKVIEEANNQQEIQMLQDRPQSLNDLLANNKGNSSQSSELTDDQIEALRKAHEQNMSPEVGPGYQEGMVPNPHIPVSEQPNILDQPELTPNETHVPQALLNSVLHNS
jgi:hypothetical protein